MNTRAERLKQARMRVNLTQAEAASRLAKAVSTIKGWESSRGAEPATLDDVVRVCQLYRISIDHYVQGTAYSSPSQPLTSDHHRLLDCFDRLPTESRQALLDLLEQLDPAKKR